MITKFAPEVSALVLPEIYAKRVTLRQGVRQMLESIPSTSYPELIEFTRVQPMRAGFVEFLDFLETEQIPIVIISVGLQGMVESVLKPYLHRIEAIHAILQGRRFAIEIDTSGAYLQVNSHYESGTEMVAKAEIMATYQCDESILQGRGSANAIGDSITDWNLAMAASIVFARPPLTQYLDDRQKPYLTWDNFLDIRDALVHC